MSRTRVDLVHLVHSVPVGLADVPIESPSLWKALTVSGGTATRGWVLGGRVDARVGGGQAILPFERRGDKHRVV